MTRTKCDFRNVRLLFSKWPSFLRNNFVREVCQNYQWFQRFHLLIGNTFMSKELHCFLKLLCLFVFILIKMNLCLIKKVTWNSLMVFFQSFNIEVVYNNSCCSNWLFSENIFESGDIKESKSRLYVNTLAYIFLQFKKKARFCKHCGKRSQASCLCQGVTDAESS